MPLFEYEATDSSGLSITAEISAEDALAAADALRARGLDVSKIVQKTSTRQGDTNTQLLARLHDHFNSPIGQEIERPPERPTTCGWCETQLPPPVTVTNCPNCGGTLPLPPGPDRGPKPPDAPRPIPRAFENKLKFNVSFWLGLVFLVIGLFMVPFTLGFTLIFAGVGGLIVRHSWQKATNRIAALKHGRPAEGEIQFVGYDKTLTVNGKHPYLITYRWEVGGRFREGQKSSWNDAALDHFRGEPVWVVFVPSDTSKSAIWPPLA